MSKLIRVKKRHRYVSLDRRLVEDERFPWAARGLLFHLLGKPDGRAVQVEDLCRRGDLGAVGRTPTIWLLAAGTRP